MRFVSINCECDNNDGDDDDDDGDDEYDEYDEYDDKDDGGDAADDEKFGGKGCTQLHFLQESHRSHLF